jgi:cytochrome c biogenesis protein CcdA
VQDRRVDQVEEPGLLVWSFFIGRERKGGAGGRPPGRLVRWRERAMGQSGSGGMGGLVVLALGAALLEVATMPPYLGAIGLLTTSDLSAAEQLLTLAGYCLVMVMPALLLLATRVLAHKLIEPVLQRLARWFEKSGGEMTAWIIGIVGFLIAREAIGRAPEVLDFLNRID